MSKAVTYAEVTLEVHEVYTHAKQLVAAMRVDRENIVEQRRLRRLAEAELTDIEFELLSDLRGANSSISHAALERLLKEEFHNNARARELRLNLASVAGNIDTYEKAVASMELDHKTSIARMHELGGYLQYLAAAKLGETARTSASASSDWPPEHPTPSG